jgi:H+/Cl- antiporter ClcA
MNDELDNRPLIERAKSFIRDPDRVQALTLWSAAVVVGLAAVFYAKVFKLIDEFAKQTFTDHPYAVFVTTPLLFLAAWALVKWFSPEASGSGIPQIMAAHDMSYEEAGSEAFVARLLSMRTAGIKILSSLVCVAAGGAIGREGPTLQISASVFYFFAKRLKKYNLNVQMSTFIVAGAAAGLASAFNTPLGGIVYAIEELGSKHFHRMRTAILSAVIISGMMAQAILGSYLYLGLPAVEPGGFDVVPSALLVGAASGAFGTVFGLTLFWLMQKRWALTSTGALATVTLLCGLVMAALIHLDPRASGTGINVITDFLFNSAPGEWWLPLTRYAATTVSYISGCAGGIFSPSLAIGAALGGLVSDLLHSDHKNLLVLLGMIGFLTGVTRAPFTSFILVLEMSDRHVAILPMMIAALVAQGCSGLIHPHSFYERVRDRYIEQHKPKAMGPTDAVSETV